MLILIFYLLQNTLNWVNTIYCNIHIYYIDIKIHVAIAIYHDYYTAHKVIISFRQFHLFMYAFKIAHNIKIQIKPFLRSLYVSVIHIVC